MTGEAWATIITSVVIPILLKTLVHYMPWLAEGEPRKNKPIPSEPEPES